MPNAETAIQKEMEQQDTGNHKVPGAADEKGADRFGGTRTGAENVEDAVPATNIKKGTGVERPAGLKENLEESLSVNGPAEIAPERNEQGMI